MGRTFTRGYCLVAVACCIASSAAAETPFDFGDWGVGQNLLIAGDFEDVVIVGNGMTDGDGRDAWSLEDGKCCDRGGDYTWEVDDEEAHGGEQSVKVIGNIATGTAWHAKVRHEGASMQGGQTYTVAFWAKAEEARVVELSVQMQQAPWDFFQGGDYNLTDEWTEYTTTFVANVDIDKTMWVGLAIAGDDVDFWIDDFRFWEGALDDEIREDPRPKAVSPAGLLTTTWSDVRSR